MRELIEYISQIKRWRVVFVAPTGVEFEAFLYNEHQAERWLQKKRQEWRVRRNGK